MDEELLDEIAITIEFKPDLLKKLEIAGWSWPIENKDPKDLYPRLFVIEVDPIINMRRILLTIAHELIHVKQWALRELHSQDSEKATAVWKNKLYKNDIDDDEVYWDMPWEVEATGREYGLYKRFKLWWRKNKDEPIQRSSFRAPLLKAARRNKG